MEITEGNVSQAAKLAGKYRADLYELLKKHDLDPRNSEVLPDRRIPHTSLAVLCETMQGKPFIRKALNLGTVVKYSSPARFILMKE